MTQEKHIVSPGNARRIWDWLQTRGGVAVWRSINLSNPGASWTCPLLDPDGRIKPKPTWEAADHPERVITDPDEIEISVDKEVKRFHIGIRMGRQGTMLKVTDGGTRRIRAAVAKAGEGAYYMFDYDTQEAVIMAPTGKNTALAEYIAQQGA